MLSSFNPLESSLPRFVIIRFPYTYGINLKRFVLVVSIPGGDIFFIIRRGYVLESQSISSREEGHYYYYLLLTILVIIHTNNSQLVAIQILYVTANVWVSAYVSADLCNRRGRHIRRAETCWFYCPWWSCKLPFSNDRISKQQPK